MMLISSHMQIWMYIVAWSARKYTYAPIAAGISTETILEVAGSLSNEDVENLIRRFNEWAC